MKFPPNPTPTVSCAHLYGGPLDGHYETVGIHTAAFADERTQAIYTHCPHATQHFQKNTFIHTSIPHDTFHQTL